MAKPERLPGGFELANGRAADRVSEKEAEAGRSRRRGRTASAAASPWHCPGLRLQRLHKAAFLGAAVSLLVRGRWEAGPRPLRVGVGGGGAVRRDQLAPLPRPPDPRTQAAPRLHACPSPVRIWTSTPRPRPAHRRGPSPANGRVSPHLATPAGRSATSSSAALRQGFALLSMGRNGALPARWWVVVLPLSTDGDWARTLFCPGRWAPPRPPRPPWSASARRLFGPGSS